MSDLPDAQRFGLVGFGPNWIAEYEPNQSPPIDGSKRELRDPITGSPFTISILPPDTLTRALSGGDLAAPRGPFDPLLEQANAAALNAGQSPLGTRVPANTNVGILDASLQANNNFRAQRRRQNNSRRNQFVSTPTGERQTIPDIAGNGTDFTNRNAGRTQANQVAISDLTQALSVLGQVRRMQETPSLTMLINPQTLGMTFSKKQIYQDRNRFNYIYQSAFDEQPRMSVTARTGAFITSGTFADANGQRTLTSSGFQYANKRDSAAWQNLMNLFTLYRNNAMVYNPDGSEAHLWVGNVVIEYDQNIYFGQFDSFSYSYDETKQHGNVEFSFDFTVNFWFDTAQFNTVQSYRAPNPSPSDSRYVGQRQLPSPVLGSSFRTNQERFSFGVTLDNVEVVEGNDATFDPLVE